MRNGTSLMLNPANTGGGGGPKSVSVSTGVSLDAAITASPGSPAYAVVGMNETEVIVAYREDTNLRVGLVEKVGSSVVVRSTETAGATDDTLDMCKLTETTALLVFQNSTMYGCVITLNANSTITIGATVQIQATGSLNTRCIYMGNGRVIVTAVNSTGWATIAKTVVVTGTTITTPTALVDVTTVFGGGLSICSMNQSEALICSTEYTSHNGYLFNVTLNIDDTLTVGSNVLLRGGMTYNVYSQLLNIDNGNAVAAYYYDSGTYGTAMVGINFLGGNISIKSNEVVIEAAISSPKTLVKFTIDDMIVSVNSGTAGNSHWIENGEPFVVDENPYPDDFLGIGKLTDTYGIGITSTPYLSFVHLITLA